MAASFSVLFRYFCAHYQALPPTVELAEQVVEGSEPISCHHGAMTGPAIAGTPIESVSTISVSKNQPAPCHPHQVP